MQVQVRDNGSPQRSGVVQVTVVIERDPSILQCVSDPFVFSTNENAGVNSVVGTVIAGSGVSFYEKKINLSFF